MTTPGNTATELYAITTAEHLQPGDLVFYADAVRIVTRVSGKAPSHLRVATIQRSWPYLSVIHVLEATDEIPHAVCIEVTRTTADQPVSLAGATGDFRRYDREQGMRDAEAARQAYENRSP